jgi:CheY-like chemotaxis protein
MHAFRRAARTYHTHPRILVAEDDPEMRRLVVDALKKDGYEVSEARDGGRLLVAITAHYNHPEAEVDLIISDVRMPVCNGLDILENLRRTEWDVPMILMTAFGDDELRARAAAAGALLFDKPFALADLRAVVADVLPLGLVG